MVYDQEEFEIRFEWGAPGLAALAPISQVVIIVDVLSFTTSVSIAVDRGAVVFPYRGERANASAYAASIGAELAGRRGTASAYSLSPKSLLQIPPGTRIVLPSLNGSTLSLAARPKAVFAGCLRNAQAVAAAAMRLASRIAVIGAGERWRDDGSLRPAFEDLVGAGAVISYLSGSRSPEAASALAAFREARPNLKQALHQCSSGKELVEGGFAEDVALASELNTSSFAPILSEDGYIQFT